MNFTTEQRALLNHSLDAANVRQRNQSGRKLDYIEGWWAIAEANRIFGFDGWTRETAEMRCVSEKPRKIGEQKKDGWGVTYIAKVRITAGGVFRDGEGAGHGIDTDLGKAHESAIKEAETDAMKRALSTFGNPFGLALYDKDKTNVAATRKSKAESRNSFAAMQQAIREAHTVDELFAWGKAQAEYINSLPTDWETEIRIMFEQRREELRALYAEAAQ